MGRRKKRRKAQLTLARGDETWRVTLDAHEFIFRSLKLPDIERLDPGSRFQERMEKMRQFREIFAGLYRLFVEEGSDVKTWDQTKRKIRGWVAERKTAL